jgi:hypothetical protein
VTLNSSEGCSTNIVFKTMIDFDIIDYNATFGHPFPSCWLLTCGSGTPGRGHALDLPAIECAERDSMADTGMSDGARDTAMPGPVVTAGGTDAIGPRPDSGGSPQPALPSTQPGSARPASNALAPNLPAPGLQLPALQPRLDAVAQIADPDLRQQVEANVRLGTARQIAAFTDGQRQVKTQAKALIDQGGDLSSIPAKLMFQVDAPGRQALRDYAMAHGNPATDPVTYYNLKNQALDDPAGFQAVDLTNHMAQLNPPDYSELQQLQSNFHNGQLPADLPLQQAYKANTDQLLQQLGLPTGSGTPSGTAPPTARPEQQQAAQLRQAIDRHVTATEIATGRKIAPADHQSLLQQIAAQHQLSMNSRAMSLAPAVAGASAPGTTSAWGAKGVSGAALASDLAIGGAAAPAAATVLDAGASIPFIPFAVLTGGMLAATTTPTAGPALDGAPPVYETLKTPGVEQPQILQREASPDDEEERKKRDEECREHRRDCTEFCLDAEHKPSKKNIWMGSMTKCMGGCMPTRCGGNFR